MAKKSIDINNVDTTALMEQKPKTRSINQLVDDYKVEFAKALPAVMDGARFARIATTALTRTPELKDCSASSLMGSLLTAASLGLEPNTPLGQAYLIPYKRNKEINGQWRTVSECQFQIGYRGLIELAHRSGELKDLSAHVVYSNDFFEYELGLEPKLKHIPAMSDRGEITWVYAVYHLTSGGFGFEVMSKDDIDKHRSTYSKAKNSPWSTSWEEMAKKTVIKKALKYAPLKSDFVKATVEDGAVFNARQDSEDIEADMSIFAEEQMVEAEVEVTEGQTSINPETGEIK